MMVWIRLPSCISHSSLSMKQSRRHWVRGLREKNSKTIKFALGAAISDWCTLKLYFRHILILTEGNVGRYNKTIYSVSVSASLVPLWFSCWSFAWSWKKLGVWSFSKDFKRSEFCVTLKTSVREDWSTEVAGEPFTNKPFSSNTWNFRTYLYKIYELMNCLNWKKTCSRISHNALSPPHHLSITHPLQSLHTDRRKSTGYIHIITIAAKDQHQHPDQLLPDHLEPRPCPVSGQGRRGQLLSSRPGPWNKIHISIQINKVEIMFNISAQSPRSLLPLS